MEKTIQRGSVFSDDMAGSICRRQTLSERKKCKTLSVLHLVFLLVTCCFVQQSAGAERPVVDLLVQEALMNNSELQALEDSVRALELEAPFFGSLQDPVAGIGVSNAPVDSFELDQEAMTQKVLFISQKFPWFGTLGLSQQAAELKALEARSRLEARKLELRKQVIGLYYEINILYHQMELVSSLQDIVAQSLRIAESRYGTGKGGQQDIFAGQVQFTELIREKVDLQSKLQINQAKLGVLLNRQDSFFDKEYLRFSSAERPQILPAIETIIEKGLTHSPIFHEKGLMVDRLRVELKLAQAAYYPDFDLRVSYGQREDDPATGNERADFVSATLAMTLPLYKASRQDAKLAAAEKRLQSGIQSLEGLRRNYPHEVSRLVAEIKGLHESYTLLNEALTVQAGYLADASLAAYSVGKVDFSTMLSSRMSLLRLQLKAEVTRYQIYKINAELEQLLGAPLSSGE